MSLTPEKRMNKNGDWVTKHVLAAPRATNTKSIPAPAAVAKKTSARAKTKVRPQQKEQTRHVMMLMNGVDERLADPEAVAKAVASKAYYSFAASEVEIYEVISSVQGTPNALNLLGKGIRSAEAAHAHLEKHGADDLAVDNSEFTNELIHRNVASSGFVTESARLSAKYPETENMVDLLELNSLASLAKQCSAIEPYMAHGEVTMSDLRELGITKFKSNNRLADSMPALKDIRTNPDSKITFDDIKWLSDKVNEQSLGNNSRIYKGCLRIMISEGKDALAPVKSLSRLGSMGIAYPTQGYKEPEKQALYAAIVGETSLFVTNEQMIEMYESGISAQTVCSMLDKGMTPDNIIESYATGIAAPVAEGWL